MELNLLLFFIEVIAHNKVIEEDINRIYEKYKYDAYRLAKESKLYNHPIICQGSIKTEVLSKRLLGLMLLSEKGEDEELINDILKLIKKGWKGIYNFISSQKKISLETILRKFAKPSFTDDEFNAIPIISLILAANLEKEITQDDTYNFILNNLYQRQQHYDEGITRFSYEDLSPKEQQKAKNIKNRIFDSYGKITYPWQVMELEGNKELELFREAILFLFDTEEIMFTSILKDLPFSQKDLEEITSIYFTVFRNQNLEKSSKFFITGLFIKMLLKAYKNVKNYYFENNKETLFLELEGYEKEIEKLKVECTSLKKENEELKKEIQRLKGQYKESIELENISLKKEINELNEKVNDLKRQEKELYSLREYIFTSETSTTVSDEITLDEEMKIPNVPMVIIGGHENLRNKLREELPSNVKVLDGTNENFDTKLLEGVEYVFFKTDYMNHGTYYKAIGAIRNMDNIKINYIKSTNIDFIKKEIKEVIG